MKTFLPLFPGSSSIWSSMRSSLESLDNKRLGKQRVEAYQIWRVITGLNTTKAWRMAPAVHMWRGYPDALGVYIDLACRVWERRTSQTTGKPFKNEKMDVHRETYQFGKNQDGRSVYQFEDEKANGPGPASTVSTPSAPQPGVTVTLGSSHRRSGTYVDGIRVPWWFGDQRVHESDAAVLYRKDPSHYRAFRSYSTKYPDYVWPRDIDPYHAEQKEELDALQAVLDAEEQARQAKRTTGTSPSASDNASETQSQAVHHRASSSPNKHKIEEDAPVPEMRSKRRKIESTPKIETGAAAPLHMQHH